MSADAVDIEDTSAEGLTRSHRGLYIVAKFIAYYGTLFMIATFFAESVLNTVRLNPVFHGGGFRLLWNWKPLEYFQQFYPNGSAFTGSVEPVLLVTREYVYVYVFLLAIYALLRIVHHKALRTNGIGPSVGGLTVDVLKREHDLLTRFAWAVTPRAGVHKKYFRHWLWYVFAFHIVTFVGSMIGVRVFLSGELHFALFLSGVIFGIGLFDDAHVLEKLPAKETIAQVVVAILSNGAKRDIIGLTKDLSKIMSEAKQNAGEKGELTVEDVERVIAVLNAYEAGNTPPEHAPKPEPPGPVGSGTAHGSSGSPKTAE